MKRKIFSKLLMGAFLIASVSSFVSCKDYDDDINNLQKQIDAAALKAELTSLQQTLAAQIAAAQSAAERAQASAEAAQKTADNAATKDALEAVKTIATNAGTAAAQGIADAANAKAAADAAQASANNAGTAAEKAAADAAKAIADAAAAQNTANVAQTAAAAAQKAAEVAQASADGANTNATKALADAATALANAASAQEAAKAAQGTADAATAAAATGNDAAKKAQATAETAVAAAANAAEKAAEALAAAQAAQVAAAEATNSNSTLAALLEKANKYADDAAAAALKAAEDALKASEDAAAAKDEAAAATKAVEEAAEAITKATDAKIAAAVAEVVANQKDIDEAQSADFAAQLETLAKAQEKLATAEALAEAVEDLEGKIEAAVEEAAVAAVAAATGTITAAVAELYAGVTSVELVASFAGSAESVGNEYFATFPLGFGIGNQSQTMGIDLNFIFGKQAWDATFGDKETESLDDDSDPTASYTKGADIRANRALLVRVNPTNAKITADQIKFIDSQLNTLDEIVKIGEPYRYEGLITRSTMESGLWVIPVEVAKNADGSHISEQDFNSVTFYGRTYKDGEVDKAGKQILYAIAINNTLDMEDAEDEDLVSRYVASTYDLAPYYEDYTPATSIDAVLESDAYEDPTHIAAIHNRWTKDVQNGEADNTPGIRSADQIVAYTIDNPEKTWARGGSYPACEYPTNSPEYRFGMRIPSAAPMLVTVEGTDKWNTKNDVNDYRYEKPFYTIEKTGDPIEVYLAENLRDKVEYWYISYDFEANAVESAPSEWEAWQSYQAETEGIYKLARGSEKIDLIVNDADAQGDVIGYRIWAVNYDGSLVDPDGKAFYIKIGEEDVNKVAKEAHAIVWAVNEEQDMKLDYLKGDAAAADTKEKGFNVSTITAVSHTFGSLKHADFEGSKTITGATNDPNIRPGKTVTFYWALLKSDKKTVASNWKDIAYIKAGIAGEDLKNLYDEASLVVYTYDDGVRGDVNHKETYKIDIKISKQMPTPAWTKEQYFDNKIVWKPDYDAATNTLTVYAKPYYNSALGIIVLNPHTKVTGSGATEKKEFFWNWGEADAKPLCNFINDNEWLHWTVSTANAGVRAIYDYIYSPTTPFTGFDRSLYKFKFDQLDTYETGDKATAKADYVTNWYNAPSTKLIGDNSVVAVMPQIVRDGKSVTSHVLYTYKNISGKRTASGTTYTWSDDVDYDQSAFDFNTKFKDALDEFDSAYTTEVPYLKYSVWEMNAVNQPIETDIVTLVDGNVYIDWKGTVSGYDWSTAAPGSQQAPTLFQLKLEDKSGYASQTFNPAMYEKDYVNNADATTQGSDLTKFLSIQLDPDVQELVQGALIGTNYTGAGIPAIQFDPAYYAFAVDDPNTPDVDETGKIKIELTGTIAKYLKVVEGSTVGAIQFEKVGGVANPLKNHNGTIKLTGYDVFGKAHEISIPVVLLYDI